MKTLGPFSGSLSHTKGHFMKGGEDAIDVEVAILPKDNWADSTDVNRPKITLLKGPNKLTDSHWDVRIGDTAKVSQSQVDLPLFFPGRRGSPLPIKSSIRGRQVPYVVPKSVNAKLPEISSEAVGNIQYLDRNHGMSHSFVSAILQDRQGYLWFGTNHGVSRYDGSSFTHMTVKEGLSHNKVASLLEDSKGNLWIGTEGGGLNYYDGHSFTHYTSQEGLIDDRIRSIVEDHHGNIWLGTHAGVSCYDGTSFTNYTTKEGLSHNSVWSILVDRNGSLWLATFAGGVTRYDGVRFTKYALNEGFTDAWVMSIVEDHRGDLWFGTASGAIQYDGTSFTHFTKEEGLSHNAVKSIVQDRNQNLWFGTLGGGVNQYDGINFTHYTTEDGLSHNAVTSIIEDTNGNLWIGTFGGGVNRLVSNGFRHFTTKDGLKHDYIRSIMEDRQGYMWFGTPSGVSSFEGNRFSHYTLREGLPASPVISMLHDSQGNYWFGMDGGGLTFYNGKRYTNFRKREGLSGNVIEYILEDQQGNLWFATRFGGLNRYDGNSFVHYTKREGLVHNSVRTLLLDRQGDIWIGTDGGISRFDGDRFTNYTIEEGLSNNWAQTLCEDSQGNIWIGTRGGGVNHFNGDRFVHFTAEDGLGNNWVRSILEDDRKNIWISTQVGLTVLAPGVSTEAVSIDLDSSLFQVFTFGQGDGLKKWDYEPFQDVYLDHAGRLWLGSAEGLTMLDVNEVVFSHEQPKVRLNTIELAQTHIDYRNLGDSLYRKKLKFGEALMGTFDSVSAFENFPITMSLPHHLDHLTFHFSAIDWTAPHQIQYSYYLEGQDRYWSPLSSERTAEYRNLSPGSYIFNLKAIGAANIWSEPFKYSFFISSPWYLSWWSKFIYGLGISSLLYWIYRFQLNRRMALAESKRLQELDQMRTKLYTNITHEFRTPLTLIMGAVQRIKGNNEVKKLIQRKSRDLLTMVNQMLDLSKVEAETLKVSMVHGDIIVYLKYILESFRYLMDSKQQRLHFLTDLWRAHMDYDPERLLQILSNLISNAVKFTPNGGDIYVSFTIGSTP